MAGVPMVEVELFGEPLVRRRLLRAAAGVTDAREAFRRIVRILEHAMDRNFSSQGAYGGARWDDLADSTKAAKRRSRDARVRANADRVLVATGRLQDSFHGGSDHVQRITEDELLWGSRVPYGVYHQSREPRKVIPHRPLRLPVVDRRRIVREVQRALLGDAS